MSMNIKFKSNIGSLDVVQTPTQITRMLLTNTDGDIVVKKSNAALHALYQYRTYVKESINGSYSSNEEYNNKSNQIKQHIIEINNFINVLDVDSLIAYEI